MERGWREMGERWERDEREMGERWERDGREMGERWERDGREMGERWERDGSPYQQTCPLHRHSPAMLDGGCVSSLSRDASGVPGTPCESNDDSPVSSRKLPVSSNPI